MSLASCAVFSPSAKFHGTEHPRLVKDDAAVMEAPVTPPGRVVIGRVEVDCTQYTDEDRGAGEDLISDDIHCNETSLTDSLKTKAARVGGDMIVERKCSETTKPDRREMHCHAGVARPAAP